MRPNRSFFVLIPIVLILLQTSCKKDCNHPPPNPPNIHLENGLLAYYAFSGSAIDSTQNHLDGTVYDGVTFSQDKDGNSNSAATFDGATGYILVNDNNGILATDSVTISFFIKLTNISDRSAIINKVNFDNSAGLEYAVNVSSPIPNNRFNFGAIPNNFDCSSTNYDFNDIIDNGFNISVGKWYHVAAIFADSVQQLYIDGVRQTDFKQPYATLNKCSDSKLVIGGWWKNDIISLHGSLDEVRIYNRPLNQDEITELAKPVN